MTVESTTYHYCIHELNGKYQWRWIFRAPPESNGNLAISPVFNSLEDAVEWGRTTRPKSLSEVWKPVDFEQHTRILNKLP